MPKLLANPIERDPLVQVGAADAEPLADEVLVAVGKHRRIHEDALSGEVQVFGERDRRAPPGRWPALADGAHAIPTRRWSATEPLLDPALEPSRFPLAERPRVVDPHVRQTVLDDHEDVDRN